MQVNESDRDALTPLWERQRAHRFYFREGMVVTSFHFNKALSQRPTSIKFS